MFEWKEYDLRTLQDLLGKREVNILKSRSLDGLNLHDISLTYGTSPQRVSQIETKAISTFYSSCKPTVDHFLSSLKKLLDEENEKVNIKKATKILKIPEDAIRILVHCFGSRISIKYNASLNYCISDVIKYYSTSARLEKILTQTIEDKKLPYKTVSDYLDAKELAKKRVQKLSLFGPKTAGQFDKLMKSFKAKLSIDINGDILLARDLGAVRPAIRRASRTLISTLKFPLCLDDYDPLISKTPRHLLKSVLKKQLNAVFSENSIMEVNIDTDAFRDRGSWAQLIDESFYIPSFPLEISLFANDVPEIPRYFIEFFLKKDYGCTIENGFVIAINGDRKGGNECLRYIVRQAKRPLHYSELIEKFKYLFGDIHEPTLKRRLHTALVNIGNNTYTLPEM